MMNAPNSDGPGKKTEPSSGGKADSEGSRKESEPSSGSKPKSEKCASDLSKDVEEYIKELNQMEDFHSSQSLNILKSISKIYWGFPAERKDLGDKLADLNYSDQLIKMLKIFNREGVFKDDSVWFSTYYAMNIIWNFTDSSAKFCKELVRSGIIDITGNNIAHEPYLSNQGSQNVAYVLKSSLSILHNLSKSVRDLPEFQEAFTKANVKETLNKHYLTSTNDFFKCVATMVITSVISEEENKMLEDTGAIPFIVSTLKKAILNTSKRRHRGFSPAELVDCLSRMAMNDRNKDKIIEEGALGELVKMMEFPDIEENAVAAHTVWILSFKKDIKEKIKAEKGLLEALDKLSKSEDKKTRKSAEGALWTLNEDHHRCQKDSSIASKNHVFISYETSSQAVIKRINSKLNEEGYRTWVDFQQMSGSTLEAMAEAVEQAAVVLICASERYKQSPNCRTEAEYTFQLKKEIIPLMMQRYYKADGWLGILLGAKFYVNFDGKYEFDHAFDLLLRELNGRGKVTSSAVDGPITAVNSTAITHTKPPAAVANQHTYKDWSEKDVENFFDTAGLSSIKHHFEGFNGKMLASLKVIKVEAPDFFYHHLETKMNLDLKAIIKLATVLKEL